MLGLACFMALAEPAYIVFKFVQIFGSDERYNGIYLFVVTGTPSHCPACLWRGHRVVTGCVGVRWGVG